MPKVRVAAYSISLDGYGAGPAQSLEAPLGCNGEQLHRWFAETRSFQDMLGGGDGTVGVDNGFGERSMANLGAWIMDRNMFGPIRGDWPDDEWKGWWGDNPPYHVPVFVLTHHPRPPVRMAGGTVFHFSTDGIAAALDLAREAAGDKDIRIGGGASTIRQYLEFGAIDEMHLAVVPVLLGSGVPLWNESSRSTSSAMMSLQSAMHSSQM